MVLDRPSYASKQHHSLGHDHKALVRRDKVKVGPIGIVSSHLIIQNGCTLNQPCGIYPAPTSNPSWAWCGQAGNAAFGIALQRHPPLRTVAPLADGVPQGWKTPHAALLVCTIGRQSCRSLPLSLSYSEKEGLWNDGVRLII
ncbi:hypothetical protein B0T16DRAFT_199364 [Cercophora newfieldiana]|uniref:Uncharacterized protein n=1 Tax=Cercophora newfieldiana TaxID=92897 RepID=A0AA39Y260_9PEZI|nr:hypothetical protein B0T16DRAFT_199364 [Cercophora newfieldiana]